MSADPTLTLQQLAALVGGQLYFGGATPPPLEIRGVASVAEAAPDEVTFLGNLKYLPALRRSQAAAVLVAEDFAEQVTPVLIRVPNPSLAFARLVAHFAPPPVSFAPGIHPTAILGEGVQLGAGVSIQPFTVLEAGVSVGEGSVVGAHSYVGQGAKIGAGCLLHPRVTVEARCVVGNRVILHAGVVLGSDGFGFENDKGRHVKIPQVGIVQVDDDVEIGANSTVDRARFGRTWIGAGTKIDNLVQIAHNVVIGKHCLIVAQVGISGSTRLGEYVTLAGQVGVAGHLEIGDRVVVSAQSGVSKNLGPNALYMGSPAVPALEYREQVAHLRRLHKLAERVQRLEKPPA
ncbi:MAG: UDP-3-O-[3-hydroxymyristoyl] glucosamine N-acyltransferase [Verrucomicrobia bacterium]|nr:MAG: UDP-3-O-[3-hydroxymyristoyl] glucosamine N-acyltransferase [Verrucomicrobiota bacterium]